MASSIKLTNANGKVLTLSHQDTHNEDNVVDVLSTAYTIETINDFATVPTGFKTVIVKDLDRGGTFIWSDIGTANGITVFAGATGYWTKQNSNELVGTIASLRLVQYTGQQIISVTGYYAALDNIGVREYYWDALSVEVDNGGTIIQVTGVVTGRWKMKYSGAVNVKWFGFSSTNTASMNSISLSNAGTASKDIIIPSGIHDCNDVIFLNQIKIIGSGDAGQCVIRNQSANPLFTFGSKFEIEGIYFLPQGVSPETIKATTQSNISIMNCVFNLSGFTGIVGTDTFESRCINLYYCSNVKINGNNFLYGWNDKTYDASTAALGNNCFRMINIDNNLQQNIEVSNNYFNDVWTAIHVSNSSYVIIDNNTIINTADTAIFERCTSGYSFHKRITNNKLKNIGKGGIKTLDTNNSTETAYGTDSIVSGNIIENFGVKLATAAIFSACHFTTVYDYSATHRAKRLTITNNIILETDALSCHSAITCTNIDDAIINGNSITLLGDSTTVDTFGAYSRYIYSNNIVNMAGKISFESPLSSTVQGNKFNIFDKIQVSNTISTSPESNRFNFIFDSNIVKTSDATSTRTSYGISNINNTSGYGMFHITNNIFDTKLAYSDSTEINTPHILSCSTNGSLIANSFIDNNTIVFTDKVSHQKIMFGDILYPTYYAGMFGAAKYNGATRVLTVKPSTDRLLTDTITFVD